MFNKSLTLNDNQVHMLTHTMKIPYTIDRDDGDAMFTVSFPSEDAYNDFMAYIYNPFLLRYALTVTKVYEPYED